MSKIIIHETDPHGCGKVIERLPNGDVEIYYYSYDDERGNLFQSAEFFIKLGLINPNDVVLVDGDNIYNYFLQEDNNGSST